MQTAKIASIQIDMLGEGNFVPLSGTDFDPIAAPVLTGNWSGTWQPGQWDRVLYFVNPMGWLYAQGERWRQAKREFGLK